MIAGNWSTLPEEAAWSQDTCAGHICFPGWLLMYSEMVWLNLRHCDHGLGGQSATVGVNTVFVGVLSVLNMQSVIKNTKWNKQKPPSFLSAFFFFPLRNACHSFDLLAIKEQANKEKIYFSLPEGLCRSACGAEIQTAFISELALKLGILLADFGTSLSAFPWHFQKNSTAPSMSRWQGWIWLSDPSKMTKEINKLKWSQSKGNGVTNCNVSNYTVLVSRNTCGNF